jgi:hypothetical protein
VAGPGGGEAGAVGVDAVKSVRRSLVASAAWADGSNDAIVPVPSQGQEAPMIKAIKFRLSAAGMFALAHFAMALGHARKISRTELALSVTHFSKWNR